MNYGDRIRDRRKAKKWSQQELSDKSGVSRPLIQLYESNEVKKPGPEPLTKIAVALGMDPKELFELAGYPFGTSGPRINSPDRLLGEIEQILNNMIPVYDKLPGEKPFDYVSLSTQREASGSLRAYSVPGLKLEPEIGEDDIIIADTSMTDYKNGDLVLCLDKNKPVIKRIKKSSDAIYLVNDEVSELGKTAVEIHGVVVGVMKKFH
jgi:transcriptional regulator with XRE-family HTH domain